MEINRVYFKSHLGVLLKLSLAPDLQFWHLFFARYRPWSIFRNLRKNLRVVEEYFHLDTATLEAVSRRRKYEEFIFLFKKK